MRIILQKKNFSYKHKKGKHFKCVTNNQILSVGMSAKQNQLVPDPCSFIRNIGLSAGISTRYQPEPRSLNSY